MTLREVAAIEAFHDILIRCRFYAILALVAMAVIGSQKLASRDSLANRVESYPAEDPVLYERLSALASDDSV